MDTRIENTRKARDLLWKLERSSTFRKQFGSAQEYLEWSLEKAIEWFDRHPSKNLKGYGEF
jgi:uncharacterized protein HemY